MKIIGVEFRIGVQNHVVGRRQWELFLHPLEIEVPDVLDHIFANVTIHTGAGDHGSGDFRLKDQTFGMHHDNRAIERAFMEFEKKYFGKDPLPPRYPE